MRLSGDSIEVQDENLLAVAVILRFYEEVDGACELVIYLALLFIMVADLIYNTPSRCQRWDLPSRNTSISECPVCQRHPNRWSSTGSILGRHSSKVPHRIPQAAAFPTGLELLQHFHIQTAWSCGWLHMGKSDYPSLRWESDILPWGKRPDDREVQRASGL